MKTEMTVKQFLNHIPDMPVSEVIVYGVITIIILSFIVGICKSIFWD